MQVSIIGLGLIGGSIGLALKKAKWRDVEIIGYIRRPEVGYAALDVGAVDKTETSLEKAVKGANLVIVATPVMIVKDIFGKIAPHLSPGCIVTDTASTKLQVMQWAKELLPSTIDFVGGHPMAGKETSGIKAASADLFHNCTYCLMTGSQATPAAMQIVTDMVKSLEANPLNIGAQEHDKLVAGISHLPLLLSVALVLTTTQNESWEQMSRLAASGYHDLTRLASSSPEVSTHICLSNRTAIVAWIDEFSKELERIRKLIVGGSDEIERALALANEARQKWLENR